ncbi:MAG: glycosyltransferase family 2 protein [Armatimonadetes bacterium]|nr:glycosyltransferase family 2 protein [Armatimonadota bacterium]
MTPRAPRLSVCIVSWNCRDDLVACLASLADAAPGPGTEVLLVDNASTDDTVDVVETRFPRVRVIPNARNRGFAAATNQALAEASGEYLLLLNPDTVVPAGALRELVAFAEAHPEAGIVAPKLLNPDGSLQPSCRRFPTPTAALFRHTLLGRLFPRNRWSSEYVMADWGHEEPREVDWVSGACLMVRRDLYEEIGPLDEEFFWGSEDVDYCYRTHRAGRKVLYTPAPAIMHRIGASTNKAQVRTILNFHRSMLRLYRKHMARGVLDFAVVAVGVSLRAILLVASWGLRTAHGRAMGALRGQGR